MKKYGSVAALLAIIALIGLLAAGSVMGEPSGVDALPEVEFLGKGAETYQTTMDDFIVKRGPEQYDFVAWTDL